MSELSQEIKEEILKSTACSLLQQLFVAASFQFEENGMSFGTKWYSATYAGNQVDNLVLVSKQGESPRYEEIDLVEVFRKMVMIMTTCKAAYAATKELYRKLCSKHRELFHKKMASHMDGSAELGMPVVPKEPRYSYVPFMTMILLHLRDDPGTIPTAGPVNTSAYFTFAHPFLVPAPELDLYETNVRFTSFAFMKRILSLECHSCGCCESDLVTLDYPTLERICGTCKSNQYTKYCGTEHEVEIIKLACAKKSIDFENTHFLESWASAVLTKLEKVRFFFNRSGSSLYYNEFDLQALIVGEEQTTRESV